MKSRKPGESAEWIAEWGGGLREVIFSQDAVSTWMDQIPIDGSDGYNCCLPNSSREGMLSLTYTYSQLISLHRLNNSSAYKPPVTKYFIVCIRFF